MTPFVLVYLIVLVIGLDENWRLTLSTLGVLLLIILIVWGFGWGLTELLIK